MNKPNILVLMSGSIACAKATALISEWVKRGHAVRVACTPSVENFVGHATLEGLSGHPVFADAFAPGAVMDHIGLAQWAERVVVCPATSNLLNKMAAGIADEAVSTLWQAAWGRNIPLFVVPAMNTRMWNYPATRESVARLKDWGVHVLPTASGDLACGEYGEGRMLEPEEILTTIDGLVEYDHQSRAQDETGGLGKRILITGGGTREPIDSVRYIGNYSTGRTAAVLADELGRAGHEVTWLGASYAIRPDAASHLELYDSFNDLDAQLQRLLGEAKYDLVIHAAAVSDFSVAGGPGQGKLSSAEDLTLRLSPNPKLLGRIRDYSCNPDVRVIGFKLTDGADARSALAAVNSQFAHAATDAVVHNDLAEISAQRHTYTLHRPDGGSEELADSSALARALSELAEDAP